MAGSRAERLARRTASAATAPAATRAAARVGTLLRNAASTPSPASSTQRTTTTTTLGATVAKRRLLLCIRRGTVLPPRWANPRPARRLRSLWRRSCCSTVPWRRPRKPGSTASPSSSAPLALSLQHRLVRWFPLRMWGHVAHGAPPAPPLHPAPAPASPVPPQPALAGAPTRDNRVTSHASSPHDCQIV